LGIQLTAEQKRLVAHPEKGGAMLVVAVAGAGKTTAICKTTQRMIGLGHSPDDILVATFSNPGCLDMQARAAKIGVPYGVNWRTLHSCGWSINGEVSNLPSRRPERDRRDPVVVDPRGENGWWVRKLLREYLADRSRGQNDQVKQLIKKMSGAVLTEIGLASAHLIWPEAWTAADGEVFPAYHEWAVVREREPADSLTADITQGFFELWESVKVEPELRRYKAPKKRRRPRPLHPRFRAPSRPDRAKVRWYSFDDQIAWPARWILEGKTFMKRFAGTFAWVIVDEAQDNNIAQTVLAQFLARDNNVIFVGDDQQSIYAFRGSKPALLRLFRDKNTIEQIQFTANFRCGQQILDVGNAILENAEDRLYDGDLQLGRTDASAVNATVTATQYEDAAEEAECVLDGIVEAIEHGVSPDDIAILYRLNSQSGPFEMACIKRRLRYRVAGGKFFNRAEIRAVMGFLAVATNEDDADAWSTVARSIVRGLGPSFLKDYGTLSAARKAVRKRGLLSGWETALKELLPIVDRTATLLKGDDGLLNAIIYLVDESGIREHYRDDAASDEDETDVDVSLNSLRECAGVVGDLDALLSYADDDTGKSSNERQPEPRIVLSTVHKAKGMEWAYVVCPGWTEGLFPFFRAPVEEERRLGYVAATRAKQYLHISWTRLDARGEPAGPSCLVRESRVEDIAWGCGPVDWPSPALPEGPGDEMPDWGKGIGG